MKNSTLSLNWRSKMSCGHCTERKDLIAKKDFLEKSQKNRVKTNSPGNVIASMGEGLSMVTIKIALNHLKYNHGCSCK